MVVVYGKIKENCTIKKSVNKTIKCPKCSRELKIGIELKIVTKQNSLENVYFPHIHIHGNPLHALLCYINTKLKVRNIGVVESIEISRNSETLMRLLEKWANPY